MDPCVRGEGGEKREWRMAYSRWQEREEIGGSVWSRSFIKPNKPERPDRRDEPEQPDAPDPRHAPRNG